VNTNEWWARISHEFQLHVREELHFLEQYQDVVDRLDDDAARFLFKMILDDEHRHHELFDDMTRAVLREGEELPGIPKFDAEQARELLEPTERFLAAERDDHKKLHQLARELRPVANETLWPLLVELMEIDTEKHVRILEYLRERLRAAAKE
jgi:rubrerythrin